MPLSKLESESRTVAIWKIAFIVLALISCATAFSDRSGFWSSYLFDIVFPAYLYIFFRGLIRLDNFVSRTIGHLSANTALVILVGVTFAMETCQYFGIYKGYFDPLDYLAYLSVLLPCYFFDIYLGKHRGLKGVHNPNQGYDEET